MALPSLATLWCAPRHGLRGDVSPAALLIFDQVSVPTAGSEGQETSENAHGASCSEAMSKGDPDAHQLWQVALTKLKFPACFY
jgi:hypothetical protein